MMEPTMQMALPRVLVDYNDPASLGSRLRARRVRRLAAILRDVVAKTGRCEVLDVGGAASYWRLLDAPDLDRVRVTVLNIAAYRSQDPRESPPRHIKVGWEIGDGRDLSRYAAGGFDLTHANSVVEHLRSFADMRRFAGEMRRVGRGYWCQTPNLWFPVDPHTGLPFVHWLPLGARVALHARIGSGLEGRYDSVEATADSVEYVYPLNRTMLRALFPDAEIATERLLGLPKSIIAVRQHPAVDGGAAPAAAG